MEKTRKLADGTGVATAYSFEAETAPAIHEQLARLAFAESRIDFDGRRVLDFGCGSGYNSYYLSERQSPSQVVGIDISEKCIAYCKERYDTDKTEYHVRDCLVHDPSLGTFDVVISCEVLEHVTEQDQFVDVIGRYLAKDGVAFISTPNRALFSLTQPRSFNNTTHVKELYYDEFDALLRRHFGQVEVHSQRNNERFHRSYVNQLGVSNLMFALRNEYFGQGLKGKIARGIGGLLLKKGMKRFQDPDYPDPRDRRYTDFEFNEGHHNHAVWSVGICREPLG